MYLCLRFNAVAVLFLCYVHGTKGQQHLEIIVERKIKDYGQNLTLFCEIDNCCQKEAGWRIGISILFLDINGINPLEGLKDYPTYRATHDTKGIRLIIQNFSTSDLNKTHECVYGFDHASMTLLYNDVFSNDSKEATTNGETATYNTSEVNDKIGAVKIVSAVVTTVVVVAFVLVICCLINRRREKKWRELLYCCKDQNKGKEDVPLIWQSQRENQLHLTDTKQNEVDEELIGQIGQRENQLPLTDTKQNEVDEELIGQNEVDEELIGQSKEDVSLIGQSPYKNILDYWNDLESSFVNTSATDRLNEHTKKYNISIVTGDSGSGKSSIIYHIALNLQKEGYAIIPYVKDSKELKTVFKLDTKQVFVIDMDTITDPNIIRTIVDIYNGQREHQFLISYRVHNLNESESMFRLNLSDMCLSEEEKKSMLKTYVGDITEDTINKCLETSKSFAFFPLLCKLCKGKPADQVLAYFSNPIPSIEEHMVNMKNPDHEITLHALALCVLCDNEFKKEWINVERAPLTLQPRLKGFFSEVYKINLKDKVDKMIATNLDDMVGTYLKKIGNCYSFVNNILLNIAAVVCGKNLFKIVIENTSDSYVGIQYFSEIIKQMEFNAERALNSI